MPYVRIWVHAVFSTKNRIPYLKKNMRKKLWNHIRENCKTKKIFLKNVNGSTDHAHCLISLRNTQSISEVMNLIKGESSYWINKEKLVAGHFKWQTEYWAASVSDSHIEKVNAYIDNQELHHFDKDFETELAELIKEHGFEKFE